MTESTEEHVARSYQVTLYEQALNGNKIIYLPTGAGKTFIAVMIIKRLSSALHEPNFENRKVTIFVVGTVMLTSQQSKYIQRLTGLKCGEYSGDMNVDFWTAEVWAKELATNQVLVMTAQILYNILASGFLSLHKINLLIFDECHAAVSDHPMRQIMRLFSMCPKEKQPKILALTATLLNSNVKPKDIEKNIKSLETTFHATIATVDSWIGLKDYCALPNETVLFFNESVSLKTEETLANCLNEVQELLNEVNLNRDAQPSDSSPVFQSRTTNSKLRTCLENISMMLKSAGPYAASKCILLYLVELERLKKYSLDLEVLHVLEYMVTQLSIARTMLEREMENKSELERIQSYSSDKVKKLYTLLKEFYKSRLTGSDNEMPHKSTFCCIIFVKQKITAKVLYHVLKALSTHDEEFKFLSPEFITGSSTSPFLDNRENVCIAKWNREVLHRFRNGLTNCMIATNVLDEGLDVPLCSLVVRYDLPMDIRSYIQSKGRARHQDGQFTMLIPANNAEYIARHAMYKGVEQQLKGLLIGHTDERDTPREEDIKNELYTTDIEPYVVTCADGTKSFLTETIAVSLINNYCANLHKSKFISLTPTWKLHERGSLSYVVTLQLPISSAFKEAIVSDVMPSIKKAKRSAAMKMCIKLHQIGELNNNFKPLGIQDIFDAAKPLFPHWKDEDKLKPYNEASARQTYKLEHPEALFGAFPMDDREVYVHIIHAKPTYFAPSDNRSFVFHSLLSKNSGFAILSAKKMPKIPSFPIYMNVGDLHVTIKVNHNTVNLTSNEIGKIRVFHSLIFTQIIPIIKSFMVFDSFNGDNCFLITPVNENWQIDWKTINDHQIIERIAPSVPLNFRNRDYDTVLVCPNYRGSPSVYVVTQICDELCPNSCFPTEEFPSYVSYYEMKHGIKIEDLSQPMLEVKCISNKINFIKPWSPKPGLSKRKRADFFEDHVEHLVPELCTRIIFPSLFWLKAKMLPSVLYRISQLLIAEDLRRTIVNEAKLGMLELATNKEWPELKAIENEEEEHFETSEQLTDQNLDERTETATPTFELNGSEIDVLNVETHYYPWSKNDEPLDLERNIDKIRLVDIEYYCQFMSVPGTVEKINRQVDFRQSTMIPAPQLRVLNASVVHGPDPVQITYALTSKSANDMFNLERLETLGDSYLKFIVSLYLCMTFPNSTEGMLTQLKSKIIGNRNLYNCGCDKRIPGRMKVEEFRPHTMVAPAFAMYKPFQNILLQAEVSPSVLYELNFPYEEQMSGCVSEETTVRIAEIVSNWNAPTTTQTGLEHFLGVQSMRSKDIADCVEALTGVYLTSMGIKGAASLLSWLGVLPNNFDINQLLRHISIPTLPAIVQEHLPWASQIEENLGYKFRNRAFLLQALTHPSYTGTGVTESYERLEFLGDAILDFLITVYIYENCGKLTPGDLTDLRSALVNNITFACLAVRHGLHTGLLYFAPEIGKLINRFVTFQEGRDHAVDDKIFWILLQEDDCKMAEFVDVPKVLGDIFESVIGAIYFDTDQNLQKVWEVVYSIMHNEIDEFCENVPKNPIRKLHETVGARPQFCKAVMVDGTETCMVPLQVTVAGQVKRFYGFGSNKKCAKMAAAKQALKYLV